MANQWYVQHGGKLYGPMTSTNLKKLADEKKISPTTQVRLGTEGTFGPASRVQGLFVAPPPPPSILDLDELAPPPLAKPLPRAAVARAAVPKAAPAPAPSLAPKILAGVALIFGILALATCWLPILGGLMGWTGIIVGALGLLLGIGGLVLAAMHKGSGLALGIAASSSSLVGLVLTLVLAIQFNLFGAPPKPIVVAMPVTPPPVIAPPKLEEPPPKEPEPEPEIVWTDASQPIDEPPIRATITSAKIEQVRMENADLVKDEPAQAAADAENQSEARKHERGQDRGVRRLDGRAATWSARAWLNSWATMPAKPCNPPPPRPRSLTTSATPTSKRPACCWPAPRRICNPDLALRPGQSREAELVFPVPLPQIEFLRLELSPAGFGDQARSRCGFRYRRGWWEGCEGAMPATSRSEVASPLFPYVVAHEGSL